MHVAREGKPLDRSPSACVLLALDSSMPLLYAFVHDWLLVSQLFCIFVKECLNELCHILVNQLDDRGICVISLMRSAMWHRKDRTFNFDGTLFLDLTEDGLLLFVARIRRGLARVLKALLALDDHVRTVRVLYRRLLAAILVLDLEPAAIVDRALFDFY